MKRYISIFIVIILIAGVFTISCTNKSPVTDNSDNIAEGYYLIKSSNNEKVIDGRGFTAEESKLFQWSEKKNSDQQIWMVRHYNNSFYTITNLETTYMIGVSDETNNVIQTPQKEGDEVLWKFEKTDGGNFMIMNKSNGKIIQNSDRNNDGSAIITENTTDAKGFEWKLIKKVVFDPIASYYIENKETGKVLHIKDNSMEYGASITEREVDESYSQQWFIAKNRDGYFSFKNLWSAKMLTDSYDKNIIVDGTGDNENYFWEISIEDDGYKIVNNSTNNVLISDGNQIKSVPLSEDKNTVWYVRQVNSDYAVPEVKPVRSSNIRVGGIAWMLWDEIGPVKWSNLNNFPERTPVLGYYNDSNPRIVDWQIKMSVESGIDFFAYNWSGQINEEGEVEGRNTFWMDAYKKAKYKEYLDYAMFIINGDEGPFTSEEELLEIFMPYLIEEHFKDPNYVLIDGKPYITFYRHNAFINNLGGVENAKIAVEKMRQMCIDAGFEGLHLGMAHHWGSINWMHDTIEAIGADSVYAYHVPTFGTGALNAGEKSYTDEEIIIGHDRFWQAQSKSELPTVLTVSVGWDSTPWGGYTSDKTWYLNTKNYKTLLENAREIILERSSTGRIDSQIVLLDNIAEFGEGHYIFPTEQYGFGHYNAIREVFADK